MRPSMAADAQDVVDFFRLIEDLGQHPHSKRQLSLSPIAITDEFPTYDTVTLPPLVTKYRTGR